MSAPTPAPPPNRRAPGLAPVKLRSSPSLQRLYSGVVLLLALLPLLAFLLSDVEALPAALWLPVWWVILAASFWNQRRRGQNEPTALSFDSGGWCLHWQTERRPVVAIGEWLLWSWLQILQFRDESTDRRWRLICLPDSASSDDRRRLRVWLNMGRWRLPS
ncbi:protein YgfX [Marinimicrobium sp. ARAG 43.8]|uniref:protein YgfX n=1 Tax=Marinimicrobium sp. ARAG 43.8 TaxID=3418719 RepID=UPI003CF36470